jgi:hypothetical protein
MVNCKHMDDRNDIHPSAQVAWDRQFDGAAQGDYRDRFHGRQTTQLAAALAVYLALLAGLALHGLSMPDPNPTSSVSNEIPELPEAQQYRRDRE